MESRRKTKPFWTPVHSCDKTSPGTNLDIKVGSLNFDFSCWSDEEDSYVRLSPEDHETLADYLQEHYGCTALMESGPFLIIECENVPSPDERPFLVVDCIALWRQDGHPIPIDATGYGELTLGAGIPLPPDLEADLVPYRMARLATMDAVAAQIAPDAIYVSFILGDLVIELPQTDWHIGLASFSEDVVFDQKFLDVECTPRQLIPSDALQIRDDYLLDSYVTGKQPFRCIGLRKRLQPGVLPDGMRAQHAIFATNSPELAGMARTADGICGAALVRCKKAGSEEDVLSQGEVGGFMGWASLRRPYEAVERVMCFCEVADSLIEDGWDVAEGNRQV